MRLTHLRAVALIAAGALAVAACEQVTREINGFVGPRFPSGTKSTVLGEVDLENEGIEDLSDRNMRTRYWEIQPGGVVPVHEHSNRPAVIYVIQGVIYEYRNDREEPVRHRAGSLSLEAGEGLVHWWKNEGEETVILVATDICEPQNASEGAFKPCA